MNELITQWLSQQGVSTQYLAGSSIAVGISFIFIIASAGYYLAKTPLLTLAYKIIIKSKNTWDDALIEHKVLNRLTLLVPFVLILFLTPIVLDSTSVTGIVLIILSKVLLTFQIARCISAVLNVSRSIYRENAKQSFLPLNAIIQILKLVLYLVMSIVIISLIVNRSPVFLLSGLGALTAVLLLIFQDTIKETPEIIIKPCT